MNKQLYKTCLTCKIRFPKTKCQSRKSFLENRKFCSKDCHTISQVGSCPKELLAHHKTRRGEPARNRGNDQTLVCGECENDFTVFEWRAKQNPKFCSHVCASKAKDFGKTSIAKRLRAGTDYKEWRTAVFERDDYTCQDCNKRGGKLQADHIEPFAFFPALRFEIDNGRALCIPCHQKTETYGGRALGYFKSKALSGLN